MWRLLSLTIVCGALAQCGPATRADDDWDDWDDAWEDADDDWEDAWERGYRVQGHGGWHHGQSQYYPHGYDPHRGYGYGHWHYYQSGYGPGVWIYTPPQPAASAPQNTPQNAPAGPARNDGRTAGPPRDHWLDDMALYENDDPVPAPMSLAPVSAYDSPEDVIVPPAPRPQSRNGSPGPGRQPFTRDVPHPLEPQGRLEPIPDERFRFSRERPAADLMFTMKPGEFAPAQSPLYEHVSMRDFENIAPGAVPVVVAVRHPGICPFPCRCHRDQVAFVQVWVPDRAARRVKVERHGTEVKLDYGSYKVRVTSRDGRIHVEYDD